MVNMGDDAKISDIFHKGGKNRKKGEKGEEEKQSKIIKTFTRPLIK